MSEERAESVGAPKEPEEATVPFDGGTRGDIWAQKGKLSFYGELHETGVLLRHRTVSPDAGTDHVYFAVFDDETRVATGYVCVNVCILRRRENGGWAVLEEGWIKVGDVTHAHLVEHRDVPAKDAKGEEPGKEGTR